jgi:Fe-S cluster biogenesis protein NfuA
VAYDGEFQEQVRQLGKLVAQFDQLPDSDAKVAGRELVQLLMDVHGRGLERVMEIVFNSGDIASGIIDKLGQDSIVGNLLLLYSLHPDELEVRVRNAVERLRPRLRKLSCTIDLVHVQEDKVQVRLASAVHSCGSVRDVRSTVEDGMYEFAPDIASLEILGLEEPMPAGFVTLQSLMGEHFGGTAPTMHSLAQDGADLRVTSTITEGADNA